MEQRIAKASHRKWMTTLAILAGIVCLVGAGVFLYSRYEQENAREYDGVLVWEPDRPAGMVWRREVTA